MLDWLSSLIDSLLSIVPRIGICRATHGGIRFRAGRIVAPVRPGLYVWWPLVTEVELVPVVRQCANLATQTLVTADDRVISLSLTVVYEIVDVKAALAQTWEVDDTVAEVAGAAAVGVVSEAQYKYLRDHLATDVSNSLIQQCGDILEPFGLEVIAVHVTDFAPCSQVLRVIGSDVMPVPGED